MKTRRQKLAAFAVFFLLTSSLSEAAEADMGFKRLKVRTFMENQKVWVSVGDLARALQVVVIAAQPDRYKIVTRDFTILEIRIGRNWIYKRGEEFQPMEDPALLFSGIPCVPLSAVKTLFGVEARWDSDELWVASGGGDGEGEAGVKRARPLSFSIDEISTYYQDPAPTAATGHDQVYASVQDFLTGQPIRPLGSDLQKMNGGALLGMEGKLAEAPLQANGSFQKVGAEGELMNGNITLGSERFRVSGGREYWMVGGLSNQFDLVDYAAVSAEGGAGSRVRFKGVYGHNDFPLAMSGPLFSQSAEVRQKMGGLELEARRPVGAHQFGIGLEQYVFQNEVKSIASRYHGEELLEFWLGETEGIAVPREDEESLLRQSLSERHYTTVIDLNYKTETQVQLFGTLGLGYFRNEKSEWVADQDWKARGILGDPGARIDLSYEKVGGDYRSIGNPFRYQDRAIVRAAPSLSPAPFLKMYGEFRREDSKVLAHHAKPSLTSTYASLGSLLQFQPGAVRLAATHYGASLYGSRRSLSVNVTRYLGRNSMDFGAGWADQRSADRSLMKYSLSGKVNAQILKPGWKVSLGEELTQHRYPWAQVTRWESLSNLLLSWGSMRGLLQYEFKPKFFFRDETLYTGYMRVGHSVKKIKVIQFFLSVASTRPALADPEVWRLGIEYVDDFF